MVIKIVFIDFDQTLYSHFEKKIPDSTVEAIKHAQEKGIKIFICTGRSLCELEHFDLSMIKVDGVIANNGQLAYDSNNKILYDCPIEGKLKEMIVNMYDNEILPMFINTESNVYANFVDDAMLKVQSNIYFPIPEVKKYNNDKFYMCSAFYTGNDTVWNKLDDMKEYANITYWHDGAVDIIPKDASKALGISKLLKYYGIDKKDSMGIGDANNDIEMIEYCGVGIAMGNATDEAKNIADYITSNVDDDGIYNAFKKFYIF